MIPDIFFEGNDLLELYRQSPDPLFPAATVQAGDQWYSAFHGRIPLSSWLGSRLPLPSIPVSFIGSPVTDLFPAVIRDDPAALDLVRAMDHAATAAGSWAVVVKDLPAGHFLEQPLAQEGFVPIDHDPVWYRKVPEEPDGLLQNLSKGRRRGLEGRIKKFNREVRIRTAEQEDIGFVMKSYEKLWCRSGMRLEKLTPAFFSAALKHPACRILIFLHNGAPFAFQMLWQKDRVLFDKYIGTDDRISRQFSFYSMSILHVLNEAATQGINWYVAGQGSGKDKAGLGFEKIKVNLWVKPLALRRISPYLLARFSRMHRRRIYTETGKGID